MSNPRDEGRTETGPATRRPGRPRSSRAERAIVGAASHLLGARGLGGLTMDAVAEAAGVSKATIYKWWPSKGSLALDVLLRGAAEGVTVHDTGDIAADLDAQMRQLIAYFRDTPAGRAIADLIAEAQRDAEIGEAFRRQWLAPRRAAAWTRLEVAQRRGEIRADLDLDLVMDMLYGPIYYRLMSGHAPLDDELAIRAVDTALRGLR